MNEFRESAKMKGNSKKRVKETSQRYKITFSPMVTQAFESKSLGGLKQTDKHFITYKLFKFYFRGWNNNRVKQKVNVKRGKTAENMM